MKPLPLLQSEYLTSAANFQTAKNLVITKCRNMSELLRTYLYYRKKYYPDQAIVLEQIIKNIRQETFNVQKAESTQMLMLTEARASKQYWRGFALLAKCTSSWLRVHPQATDPWNIALNIGYTMLANDLRPLMKEFGFSLEIGLVHSPRKNRESLLYDFQEIFRQPLVDLGLLSWFARSNAKHMVTAARRGKSPTIMVCQK